MLPLACIVACARQRVIGLAGSMPWHEPDDLKYFKAKTMGHALIMGRASFASIGRPLPGRRTIIVSGSGYTAPGCDSATSLEEAIALARQTDAEPFICGGGQIYAAALPLVTRLYLTELAIDADGDTFFPALDEQAWEEVSRETIGRRTNRVLLRRGEMR